MRVWVLVTILLQAAAQAEVIRFDRATEGSVPPGWKVAMTHTGGVPKWEIVRDESAPHPPLVLAQVSRDSTAGRFPLVIWDRASLRNGEVSVAFKPVDGSIDRAAGIENNVVLYKVQGGTRLSIAPKGLPSRSYGMKHEVPSARWSTLRVVVKDNLFTVFLNGERLFETEDQTFTEAGKVGLWTKADSLTYFADFTFVKQ